MEQEFLDQSANRKYSSGHDDGCRVLPVELRLSGADDASASQQHVLLSYKTSVVHFNENHSQRAIILFVKLPRLFLLIEDIVVLSYSS